jgi:signal transduction histidine kinase
MNALRNMLFRVSHSLTARLLLIFFIASMAYWQASVYAFRLFQDTDYLRRIAGAHTALHTEYILNDIGWPPDVERAQAIADRIPVDIRIVGPNVDWSSSPEFYSLEEIPFGPLTWLELGEASRLGVEEWSDKLDKLEFSRYKEHSLIKINERGYEIVFVSPRISEMPVHSNSTLVISLIGIAVLFLCYLAVRWVFIPIRWMQEGASRIGRGELDYRIPTRRHDELGDLSRDINEMADDVQGMLEAKRQLMLAISHELRSPLTRSKVALELIDDDSARRNVLDDINEMERLITDLLESDALNSRHAIVRREPVDPEQFAEAVLSEDFADRHEGVDLTITPNLPIADLDITRMRLLLRNLIDNALRYTPEGAAPVEVSVGLSGDNLSLVVRDHGPGIPAEHLEHVTEPFYRADPARSRATGGVGLGLYLCTRVAEVHGGSLTIASDKHGTVVTVVVPLHGAP